MLKVLSTKPAVDELDRFREAAEQRGLSKAGLLKNLVEEYLGGSNEENETSINSQGKASLAKVPDSKKAIIREPSIEQGLLKVKTQARSKTGFGELLFFGLIALGIVSALKRNSNQKILPELNCDSYADYNEDIAAVYRDMGLSYP